MWISISIVPLRTVGLGSVFRLLSQPWTTTIVGTLALKLEDVIEPALFRVSVCDILGFRLRIGKIK